MRSSRCSRDPGARARRCAGRSLEDTLPGAGYAGVVRHGRFDRVVVFHAGRHPELRGRSVAEIAAERGADGFDTFLDLIVEEDDDIVGLFDYIEEKNIRACCSSPIAMISSDGLVMRAARRSSTTRRCTGPAATGSTRACSSATCARSRCCASRRPSAR